MNVLTWEEACQAVGYNQKEQCPIERKQVFYAYKRGEVKKCATRDEARQFSENYESGYDEDSIREWDAYWQNRQLKEKAAVEKWYDAMRIHYSHLSDPLFELCYSNAYSDGHSAGYDEVASYMDDYVDFAEAALKIGG